jgi:hypothetical protein
MGNPLLTKKMLLNLFAEKPTYNFKKIDKNEQGYT